MRYLGRREKLGRGKGSKAQELYRLEGGYRRTREHPPLPYSSPFPTWVPALCPGLYILRANRIPNGGAYWTEAQENRESSWHGTRMLEACCHPSRCPLSTQWLFQSIWGRHGRKYLPQVPSLTPLPCLAEQRTDAEEKGREGWEIGIKFKHSNATEKALCPGATLCSHLCICWFHFQNIAMYGLQYCCELASSRRVRAPVYDHEWLMQDSGTTAR